MMLLLLFAISTIKSNVFDTQGDSVCENPCLVCQKTAYKLKFQQSAGCERSACLKTCEKIHEIWGQPNSPFEGFRRDLLGKCDSCFRAGYCSITECDSQKTLEKTVIDQVVNNAKLSGVVDSSGIDKMMEKVMKNRPVNFLKYSKKIEKQIKKSSQPKVFRKNFKKIASTLKDLAGAGSMKDLKKALRKVEKAVSKAGASQKVRADVKQLAETFMNLCGSKKGTKSKKSVEKILRTANKVKVYIKGEMKNLETYAKRIRISKKQVERALKSLKGKKVLDKKTKKRIGKLSHLSDNLKQTLIILDNTEKDIKNTLTVIKKAASEFKN